MCIYKLFKKVLIYLSWMGCRIKNNTIRIFQTSPAVDYTTQTSPRVTWRHWLPVRGPPYGPGPWTSFTDPHYGPPQKNRRNVEVCEIVDSDEVSWIPGTMIHWILFDKYRSGLNLWSRTQETEPNKMAEAKQYANEILEAHRSFVVFHTLPQGNMQSSLKF